MQKFLEAEGASGSARALAVGTVVAPSRVSYTAVPRDILGELVQAPERRPQPQPGAVSPGGRCGPARACAVLTAAPRRPPPARDLLLRPAQPAQERLHGAAAVHAGQPGHAPGARPAPRAHQGQHVPDLLVQQGPLPLPDQRLLAAAARWVRLGRWKCVCVHEGVCLRARVKFALVYPAVLPPFASSTLSSLWGMASFGRLSTFCHVTRVG